MGKKKKVILPPDLPPEIRDDEIHVSDEDVEFVRSNQAYAGFLSRLDTKAIDRHVVRVADVKEDELEDLYEKRSKKAALRKQSEESEVQVDPVDALPIKTLDGQLYYRTAKDTDSSSVPKQFESLTGDLVDGNNNDANVLRLTKAERRQKLKKSKKDARKLAKSEVLKDITDENPHAEVLAKVEEDLSAEGQFISKKNRLAEIGISLLEDPESNIKSLKDLMQFCSDKDAKVVKLGLLSLLAVFKDIIPGYRIRLPTEKELQMKVSKDVRKTRFYESTLLHSYKAYLMKLTVLEKKGPLRQVAVRCLCSLLEAVPHFNYWENLLSSAVKNITSPEEVIRKYCCGAMRSVFTNEGKHGGEVTLQAVRLIAMLVKSHDCLLHPDCIEVFLSLTFDEDIGRYKSKEKETTKHTKKRQRKNFEEPKMIPGSEKRLIKKELAAKTREEVKADLKAVSFAPESDERRWMQSDTLSALFETYFRVLKHSIRSDTSMSEADAALIGNNPRPLLAPCLRGLAKFSHLIDLDYMGDVMGCLKKLAGCGGFEDHVPSDQPLSVSERLQCCIVAFKVMRSNLDALNVDLQDFFVNLYNLLLEYRPGRDQGEVLAEALKIMLCEGRQHDMQRAAAFVKRLATFCLCFGSAEASAALITLKHLLQRHGKCRNLLENDSGGGSLSGLVVKYQPDAVDPNLSGALASVLWELSLLSKHYHPTISSMASSIASSSTVPQHQLYLSTSSPQQAFADLSIQRESFNLVGKATLKQRKGRNRTWPLSSVKSHQDKECLINEDELQAKLDDHFRVLQNFSEDDNLRRELNKTLASVNLYQEYKRQKKKF